MMMEHINKAIELLERKIKLKNQLIKLTLDEIVAMKDEIARLGKVKEIVINNK